MRWGIVGFGWVARDYMAPGIAAAGGHVAAVCDPGAGAREAAQALGATVHTDLADFLAQPLDAIYVATPNHLHRDAVVAAAEAGVPVLCEKPLAATLADAEVMIGACGRAAVLFGTAFDQRHHPAHVAVRDALAGGAVGTVTAVRIAYGCWLGREWTAGAGCNGANWRIDAGQAGGGAVIDLAPHGLDLVHALLGEPVVELQGLLQRRVQDYPVDDGGLLIGRTGSGVLVSIHNSYNTPDALPRRRLEILGSRGQITATNTMGQTPGGKVEITDGATGGSESMPFDAALSPFAVQAAAFAEAVAGRPHPFDAARDLAAMRLLSRVLAEGERRAPGLNAAA